MRPRNELVARLMAVSVACQESLEQENWQDISDLLETRGNIIEKLADMPLSKRDIETVRKADHVGRQVAQSMAHLLALGRSQNRKDRAAIKMVKHFEPSEDIACYELTG